MTEPHPDLTPLPAEIRHDGWTTVTQIVFLETLASTGIVTHACGIAQMSSSSAYLFRRKNSAFAAAWEEALCLAREKLADALLERSLEGQTEYYYRDGELVGEKKVIDSRLGLALLRRLDKQVEARAAGLAPHPGADFDRALDAVIRQGEVPQVDKVDKPPISSNNSASDRTPTPKH
ncbi:hypothetical protein [Sphingomicrobium arenosum]|uniref:hypothetical protein n=1 Tax=Sphingomicrobium arenosum TaxID=2233861 RepID=UPI00223F5888|nr:hypothetical protein [Sphingomicrobium arenosum]